MSATWRSLSTPRAAWFIAGLFVTAGVLHLAIFGVDSSVTSDDGAYELPVRALRTDGEWSIDYVLAEVDPDGLGSGGFASPAENGFFPYTRRPLWVASLFAADWLGGIWGQRLLLLIGGAAAVLTAPLLARAVGAPRAGVLAAVLAALSPLFVNAMQLWAHAPAAAIVGGLMWLHLRWMAGEQPPPSWLSALGLVGALAAPAIRTEGAIFVLAVAAVSVLQAAWKRQMGLAVYGCLTAGAGLAGHIGSSLVASAITGSDGSGGTLLTKASGGIGGRIEGLITTLVSTPQRSDAAFVLGFVPLLLVVYGVILLRRRDMVPATVVLGISSAMWILRLVAFPGDFPPGLLVAWPVAVLVFAEPWSARTAGEKRLAGMVGLAFLGVFATQYDIGGGLNWGGRFLSSALPALAVLVATTLTRVAARVKLGFPAQRVQLGVITLVAVVTVASAVGDADNRTRHDDVVHAIEMAAPDRPVVTSSLALPRLAWRTYPAVSFVFVPEDGGVEIRRLLEEAGHDSVVAVLLSDEHYEALTGRDRSTHEPGQVQAIDLAVAPTD